MIHLLFVLDRRKSVGAELYNTELFHYDAGLLVSLVQTILIMAQEIDGGEPKGEIRELEIGQYQIGVIEKDHLSYIFIQDTYDNEEFTKNVVDYIIDEFHSVFLQINFNFGLPNEKNIRMRISHLLTTMHFPEKLLPELDKHMNEISVRLPTLDTLFLSDLDDGIIKLWQWGDENIVRILLTILSELPFERSWVGESRISFNDSRNLYTHEAWVIQRIGMTDYCLLARVKYVKDQRNNIIDIFEEVADIIQELIFNFEQNQN